MNEYCNGDYYIITDVHKYRCLYNGKSINASKKLDTCPEYDRKIEATYHKQVKILHKFFVFLPSLGWVKVANN